MKQLLMKTLFVLCALALLCVGMTACNTEPTIDDTTAPTTTAPLPTRPTVNLVEADDSALIGEWDVVCEKGTITHLAFQKEGTVIVTTQNGVLGGSFVHEGESLTIVVNTNAMAGTVTVDGNTATFTTDNDTLTLTKVQ